MASAVPAAAAGCVPEANGGKREHFKGDGKKMKSRKELVFGWILLVLVSVLYFFANAQKILVPGAIFRKLETLFQVGATEVTRLGAGFMYVYSLCQLLAGLLADRFCGTRVVMAGGAVFCLGSVLSALDGSIWILLASRILTGLGASVIYLSMVKMVTRISGAAYTMVLGIIMIVGYSGSVAGGAPFEFMVDKLGFSRSMLIIGLVTTVFYMLFVAFGAASKLPPIDRSVKLHWKTYAGACGHLPNIYVWLTIGFAFSSFYAMQTVFGKKFMEDFSGVSGNIAGTVMSVTMIIASVNAFIVASLSKLLGDRRRVFMIFCGFGSLTGTLLLFCSVLFNWTCWVVAAAGWILLAFSGNISTISTALLRENNPEWRFGTVLSIGNCFAYLLLAIIGNAGGYLMDIFPPRVVDGVKIYGRCSYMLLFGLLVGVCLISAVMSLKNRETGGVKQVE